MKRALAHLAACSSELAARKLSAHRLSLDIGVRPYPASKWAGLDHRRHGGPLGRYFRNGTQFWLDLQSSTSSSWWRVRREIAKRVRPADAVRLKLFRRAAP